MVDGNVVKNKKGIPVKERCRNPLKTKYNPSLHNTTVTTTDLCSDTDHAKPTPNNVAFSAVAQYFMTPNAKPIASMDEFNAIMGTAGLAGFHRDNHEYGMFVSIF